MRSFFNSLLGYFLTPAGVLLMGTLDASLIFFLPLGIDFVVIIMAARKPELFWMYALLATIGSVTGAGLTYWIGRKAGAAGLRTFLNPKTLARVQKRVETQAALPIAALGVIPPPFPFTAFVLAAGAWKLSAWKFLSALAAVRAARFGVETALAAHYGNGIISWMESKTFTIVIVVLAVLAVVGTVVSAVLLYRSGRRKSDAGVSRATA